MINEKMKHEYAKMIGYRIRQERILRKISQAEIAEKLLISSSYYSNIECGNRVCPTETLIGVCRELSVSSDRILRDFVPVSSVMIADITHMFLKLNDEEKLFFYNMVKAYVESNPERE